MLVLMAQNLIGQLDPKTQEIDGLWSKPVLECVLTGKRTHLKVLYLEKIAMRLMNYNVLMHSLSTISKRNLLYQF